MDREIIFKDLSHVEYIPSVKLKNFQLLHKKGDPVVKTTWLGKEKITKKVWGHDSYGYPDSLFNTGDWTKEDVIKVKGIPEELFDEDGYIWDYHIIVIHFLDGTKIHRKYIHEEDAVRFFNQFKQFLNKSTKKGEDHVQVL